MAGAWAAAWIGLIASSPAPARGLTLTRFETVRLEAPVRVEILTGRGNSARGEGDDAAFDRLDIAVNGGTLTIRMRAQASGGVRPNTPSRLTLFLTTGNLRRVSVTGGGSLTVDKVRTQDAILSLSGNGDLSVGRVEVDRLTLLMAGGGRMRLAGRAANASVQIIGPGQIAADGLLARDVNVTNSGPGSVILNAVNTARVLASGSGDTTVIGKPACKVTQNGTGRVNCGGTEY